MIKKISNKFILSTLILSTLIIGFLGVSTNAYANPVLGQSMTVPHNALIFANSTTTVARGQINQGTRIRVDVLAIGGGFPTRWFVAVTGGTAAQHNGWLGTSHWVNDVALRN